MKDEKIKKKMSKKEANLRLLVALTGGNPYDPIYSDNKGDVKK